MCIFILDVEEPLTFPVHPRAGLGSGLQTLEAKTFARSPCHPNTDPLCLLVSPRGLFVGGIQADHDLDNVFAFIAELDLKIDPREAAAKATVPPGRWWVWELGGSG